MNRSVDLQAVLAGERRALARALSEVENDSLAGRELQDALFPHSGRAHMVGVTGSPGAGKSSLVNRLAFQIRKQGQRVGILAVDPSSPFTGGAILGDRVRMHTIAGDAGVFIRSMATRGTLGGLARKTAAMAQVLDAAGYEMILIETVGAGQSEVDIACLAHTTIVVEAPGMGDDIQAIKAGILEIADILVVNKADHPLVEMTRRALQSNLELAHPQQIGTLERMHHHTLAFNPIVLEEDTEIKKDDWFPPILSTVSTKGTGVEAVVQAIRDHREYLQRSGQWRQREGARLQEELNELILEHFASQWRIGMNADQIALVVKSLLAREYSPQQAIAKLIAGGGAFTKTV